MPSIQQVRFSSLLTDFAVGYMQRAEGYAANRIAPLVNVSKQTGQYRKFSKADFFRDDFGLRAPGSPAPAGTYGQTFESYACAAYALKHAMPDEVRSEYDAEGPSTADQAAAGFIAQKALIKRERLMVSSLVLGSTWTAQADQTGVASGPTGPQFLQWADAAGAEIANSDPILVLSNAAEAVKNSIGQKANRILMPSAVWQAVRRHSAVRGRLSNDSLRIPSGADLEALLDMAPGSVVITEAVYNSAFEGVTPAMSSIMGKHVIVLYVDDSAGISKPTAAKQFSWTEFDDIKEARETGAPGVRTWRDPDESARTDWYGGEINTTFKITATDAGAYLASVIG